MWVHARYFCLLEYHPSQHLTIIILLQWLPLSRICQCFECTFYTFEDIQSFEKINQCSMWSPTQFYVLPHRIACVSLFLSFCYYCMNGSSFDVFREYSTQYLPFKHTYCKYIALHSARLHFVVFLFRNVSSTCCGSNIRCQHDSRNSNSQWERLVRTCTIHMILWYFDALMFPDTIWCSRSHTDGPRARMCTKNWFGWVLSVIIFVLCLLR